MCDYLLSNPISRNLPYESNHLSVKRYKQNNVCSINRGMVQMSVKHTKQQNSMQSLKMIMQLYIY